MIEERTLRFKAYDDLTGIGEYKSPIELIESRIQYEKEEMVLKAIQKVGVNVDKEELIRALNYDRNQFVMGYKRGFEAGKSINEWIPCEERLPEIEEEVLVQWKPYLSRDIEMNILVLNKLGEWVCGMGRINGRAIAWMRLPEPYESEVE